MISVHEEESLKTMWHGEVPTILSPGAGSVLGSAFSIYPRFNGDLHVNALTCGILKASMNLASVRV
jgi:hypothetical protein